MLEAATFVNQIFRNFGWNDSVKSFFCIVGTSWMGWGRVEWHWHMGMSYLTSLNTQLFKNIAYVGSFGHILFNLIFNVNSNLAESSANCSDTRAFWNFAYVTLADDGTNSILTDDAKRAIWNWWSSLRWWWSSKLVWRCPMWAMRSPRCSARWCKSCRECWSCDHVGDNIGCYAIG